jgi:hypothetical protein
LLNELCEEVLDQAGQQRLEAILAESEDARRLYLSYVDLHANMALDLVLQPSTTLAPTPSPRRARAGWRSRLNTAFRYASRPAPVSLMTAAIAAPLLLLGLLYYIAPQWWEQGESAQPNEVARVEQANEAPFVARLTHGHQLQWADDTQETVTGAFLKLGQRIQIASGLAEIEFNSGARVVLHGPAGFLIDGTNACHIEYGSAVARVPKRAAGFVALTSVATFVDLGTEFGVAVRRGGPVDVSVFEGEIRLSPSPRVRQFKPRIVSAGESLRIDASGALAAHAEESVSFVRRIPGPDQFKEVYAETFDVDRPLQVDFSHGGRAEIRQGQLNIVAADEHSEQYVDFSAMELAGATQLPSYLRAVVELGAEGEDAGPYHIAVVIGQIKLVIHPGYPGGAFRVQVLNPERDAIANTDIGWTPALNRLHTMTVLCRREATTTHFRVSISDADMPKREYVTTFTLSNDEIGEWNRIALVRSGNPGGDACFGLLRVEVIPPSVLRPAEPTKVP